MNGLMNVAKRKAPFRLLAAGVALALLSLAAPGRGTAQQTTVSIEVIESVGVADSQQALPPSYADANEGVGVTDAVSVVPPVSIDVVESVGVADSQQALPPAYADTNEGVGVTDAVSVVPPVSIEVNESVSVADSQQALPPLSTQADEGVQVTDTVQVVPPAVIEVNETIGVIDSLGDSDGDGAADLADNCAATGNSNQDDGDVDAVGDACDTCPATANGPAQSRVLGVGYQVDSDSDAEPGTQPPAGADFGGDACDVDDDNDGLPDSQDLCRILAEDYDGWQDEGGCPDTDNDGDGICDPGFLSIACVGSDDGRYQWKLPLSGTTDCRNVTEDFDNFHDNDGCPEPDNDYDTFADQADDCPGADSNAGADGIADTGDEPVLYLTPYQAREDFDGVIDTDGCHDSPDDDYDGDGAGDETEVFTMQTDPVNPDTDADTVADGADNCPLWLNTAQTSPNWPIPANDSDCDGFNRAREQHVGTDPTKHCNANSGFNNEPDAWPTDFNDSRLTDLSDVVSMGPTFNKLQGQPGYNQRYDLDASNSVVLTDVILMGPFWLRFCT